MAVMKPALFFTHSPPKAKYIKLGLLPAAIAHFNIQFSHSGLLLGRLIFTLQNELGDLVGVVGWNLRMSNRDGQKYLAVPSDAIQNGLFNICQVRTAAPDRPLLIVQDFVDCVRLWQRGFDRCVVLPDTTMSHRQENIIASLLGASDRVVVIERETQTLSASLAGRLARYAQVRVLAGKGILTGSKVVAI